MTGRNFAFWSLAVVVLWVSGCGRGLAPIKNDAIRPVVVTQPTPHDTDDPAIWINPADATKSLIVGTDKDSDGALYLYDLSGKILRKSVGLKRPNNVDIAYGLEINGKKCDIAVATERETQRLRVFSLPDLEPIDNGGIAVFEGESDRDVMGVALYTDASNGNIYAIVGRKTGPSNSYLGQYLLQGKAEGSVGGTLVRKFGKFSGRKEIEAIAVDNESGFVYYCDETVGIRKYSADPKSTNVELALFGTSGFTSDHEGIAIYKTGKSTGYILVSNQQANSFMVFAREGEPGNANQHDLLAEIPVAAIECDGADASNVNFGPNFPNGMLVAMSNGMTFHFYDWRMLQQVIDAQRK